MNFLTQIFSFTPRRVIPSAAVALFCISPFLHSLTAQMTADDVNLSAQGMRVVQLVSGETLRRNHPEGLPSLLAEITKSTNILFSSDPIFIRDFTDPRLFESPLAYVNFADRSDWNLTTDEVKALQKYLNNGGFLYIDAGINASFLRDNPSLGQSHSFGDWEPTPILADQMKRVFPHSQFVPLPRSHPIFQGFYSGLPDPEPLPESIRDYIVNEKWPQGSYAALALNNSKGRMAVLTTPIISMGWGRDRFGRWISRISFRVREAAEGLDQNLQSAAYSGQRFEVTRPDGLKDVIYCQPPNVPAWVNEPDGRWRVFRYYQSETISDYAHEFYTRLGVNIFVFVMTQG